MMKDLEKNLMSIIKAYLLNKDNSMVIDADEQLASVYELLKRHDMAHLLGVVLLKKPETREKHSGLVKSQFAAVMRYEKGKYVREKIYGLFEKNKIAFLPLKGSVLCDYYPEPWHRTSCDIDILVHVEELDKAVALLEKEAGFKFERKSAHDVSLYSPDGVHLELHFDFHEENISVEDGWNSAAPIEGSEFHYALTHEAFALHHIAHTAKHCKYGGCGLRFFVDLWIIIHNMKFDKNKLDAMLEERGLAKFAKTVFDLVEVWFDDGEETDMTKRLAEYVLNGGIYGNVENLVVIGQTKHTSKFKYAMTRIFQPYNTIKRRYPILEKHRWLLPICQVRRWFDLVFKERKINIARNEFKINSSVDEAKKDAVLGLLSDLEIM